MLVYSKLKKLREGDVLEIIVETNSSQEQDIIKVLEYFRVNVHVTRKGDTTIYTVIK
ncbi:hypothetical protein DJ526_09765 [Sulfolobus sp. A20-N-G8]|nr:hypothetical protein DJ526_09765 [Sulfolobus sp. A20-N-G8]